MFFFCLNWDTNKPYFSRMLTKNYFLNTKLNPGAYAQLRNVGFRKVKRKPGLELHSNFTRSVERLIVVTKCIITIRWDGKKSLLTSSKHMNIKR